MGQLKQQNSRIPRCEDCPVRQLALFQPLSPGEVEAIQKFRSEYRVLAPGEAIFRQGEPTLETYTLFSGWAFLYQNLPDGRRQILRFLLPGDFLGFQADMEEGVRGHSAQALTEASVCVFPRGALLKMFRKQSKLGVRLIWLTAQDQAIAHEHLASLGRRNALERVAYLLLEVFQRVRMRNPGDDKTVPFPFTQDIMADAVGLTNIHVNRTLRQLRESGLIVLKSRRLHIPDPEALAEQAGVNVEVFARRAMI